MEICVNFVFFLLTRNNARAERQVSLDIYTILTAHTTFGQAPQSNK